MKLDFKTNSSELEKPKVVYSLELAKELHKPIRHNFERRRIITKGINELWAADLLIMTTVDHKINRGFKYMLNVIDTFSKFAYIEPLKKKDGPSVSEAFERIIKKSDNPPKLLHTDAGKEFLNTNFQKILKKYNIKMYQTHSEIKSSIIERFNRTINQKLKIQFEVQQNNKWIDIIDKLLYEYNFKDNHRTIGMKPSEVNYKNENDIYNSVYKTELTNEIPCFKIGDKVRIYAYKKTFENKYKNNWTHEIFIVNKIYFSNPITYSIMDLNKEQILGKFYKYELQKTLYY